MSFAPLSEELDRYRLQGGDGPRPITGTTAVAGRFYEICAASGGATITTMTITGKTDNWVGFALDPGECIKAGSSRLITSITLSARAIASSF